MTDGPAGRLAGIVTRQDLLRRTVRGGEASLRDVPDDVLVQHYVSEAGSR